MSTARRLNTTIEPKLADRVHCETDGRTPRLPKRYVVEFALKRLFDDLDRGQLKLDLADDVRDLGVGQGRQATDASDLAVQRRGGARPRPRIGRSRPRGRAGVRLLPGRDHTTHRETTTAPADHGIALRIEARW